MRVLLLLLSAGCASTWREQARSLEAVRLEVTWNDGAGIAGLDPVPLVTALAGGASSAAGVHYLPFVVDGAARPALTIELGPALAWRASESTMLIELPLSATLADAAGQPLDRRSIPCADEGVPAPGVLVAADHDPPPERLRQRRSRAAPATWDDLGRAYAALAAWCGERLIEELSGELR